MRFSECFSFENFTEFPRLINSVSSQTSLKCHKNCRQLKFPDISQHNCILLRFSIFHFPFVCVDVLHNRFRRPHPRRRRARIDKRSTNVQNIFSSSVSFLIASRSCKNLAELLKRGDGDSQSVKSTAEV